MKKITIDNFSDEVLQCQRPFLLLFKSRYCHLCDGMVGVMFRIKVEYSGLIKVGYVETSEDEDLTEMFELDGVPSLFFFRDGEGKELGYPERPDLYSGYSEEHVRSHLDKLL